jgi:glutathione synthase/RimK-type ligase-like ATP-grasp enzyme
MPAVLLATCAELPEGDEDGGLLATALAAQGITATWAAWDDAAVDWAGALVVLRSTWDYTPRRDAFLEWVSGLPRVANDAEVVRWNTDKVYLRDLAAAGVPVVDTTFAKPGEHVAVGNEAAEFVVKPSVGAGSRGVGRFTPDRSDAARAHAAQLHAAGRTVMVQPYLAAVETAGETALIYVDGRFSHAIRKNAMLAERATHPVLGEALYLAELIEARVPEPEELAVGAAVLDVVRERFGADKLYTRVDLLPGPDGPVLVELELTEPSLFLQHGSGADDPAAVFAAAIAARV